MPNLLRKSLRQVAIEGMNLQVAERLSGIGLKVALLGGLRSQYTSYQMYFVQASEVLYAYTDEAP